MNTNPKFSSTSLNWDLMPTADQKLAPTLNPRDIIQIAFLLERGDESDAHGNGEEVEASDGSGVPKLQPGDTRTVLGQLWIQWRGSMGDRGSLKTAWLTTRR